MGAGGGLGIQTHTYGVVMPSPRSWYQPVGYSMTVGTGAPPPGTAGAESYTYGALAARTGPDPMIAGYDGKTRDEPNGTPPP